MTDNPNTVWAGTALLLAVLGGVFFLAYHGTFTGAEAFGIVTSIIGVAAGILGVHSGVTAGRKAATAGRGQTHVTQKFDPPATDVTIEK